MGKATFKMVAATDGSPPSPSGYWYYLLAHAIATALLLVTLVAAVWQFMDWIVTPSCLADTSLSSASSSAGAAPATTTAPVASSPVRAGESRRTPGRTGISPMPTASYQYSAQAELALRSGECPCPQRR
jgi:hypothetical protein